MVYCVMPSHAPSRVRRSIERALSARPEVEVVLESRTGERRATGERRTHAQVRDAWSERRRIRYSGGRRVAERRAVLVPVPPPADLPRAARAAAGAVSFMEALVMPSVLREDVEAVRAIVRYQSGERDLAELYSRWVDPVYTYLRVTLDRHADLEAHLSRILAQALREARETAPGPDEVRPWLFGLAHRLSRGAAVESPAVPPAGDMGGEGATVKTSLDWLSDEDLVLLIQRRPPAERHAMVLRYFAGLSAPEIARAMEVTVAEVVALHGSAVGALEASLSAVTRSPRVKGRHPMGRLTHQTPVLSQRRRALLAV